MKVKYQMLNGTERTKEFATVDEFIMLQNREIPAIEDSFKVLSLEINGTEQEFTGSIFDLYNHLNK
jgi:hypothetical protein